MELYPLFQKLFLPPLSVADGMSDTAVTVLTHTVALGAHCSVQADTGSNVRSLVVSHRASTVLLNLLDTWTA
jgi:hypothetical protein